MFFAYISDFEEAFPKAKLVVVPNALLRVVHSMVNTMKKKYSVKITGESIGASAKYCLKRVSISPYDTRFIEKHSWLEAAYALVDKALTATMHCKTLERAVNRLLFTDMLEKEY